MLKQPSWDNGQRIGFFTSYDKFCDEVCQQMLYNPLRNLQLVHSICRTFEELNPELSHSDLHLINTLRKVVDERYPDLSVQELNGNLCLVRDGVHPGDLNVPQTWTPRMWVMWVSACITILVLLAMANI